MTLVGRFCTFTLLVALEAAFILVTAFAFATDGVAGVSATATAAAVITGIDAATDDTGRLAQ